MGAGPSCQKGGYVYSAVRHHRSTTVARGVSLNKTKKNNNKSRKGRKGRKGRKTRKNRKSHKSRK